MDALLASSVSFYRVITLFLPGISDLGQRQVKFPYPATAADCRFVHIPSNYLCYFTPMFPGTKQMEGKERKLRESGAGGIPGKFRGIIGPTVSHRNGVHSD
eukprot:scaffold19484_cov40-Cyclotella_meneghiniana.AAC.2